MTKTKNYNGNSVKKFETTTEIDSITQLKSEIRSLEQELSDLKQKLQPFQNLIYNQLQNEIRQLAMLSELHKKYRANKKQKRREQKQKGKNYKAPQSTVIPLNKGVGRQVIENYINPELKKLYREAIIKIHPDKISHYAEKEEIKASSDLTAQLNEIYKNGDLDELKLFYFSIANSEISSKKTVRDNTSKISKEYENLLLKTQVKLMAEIENLKSSSYYYYHQASKKPQDFIDDLREKLLVKINKLEKRTRKIT